MKVYKKQFKHFFGEGVATDAVGDTYDKLHADIRKDPAAVQMAPIDVIKRRRNPQKPTLAERKERVFRMMIWSPQLKRG